jgi:hypothetical protein
MRLASLLGAATLGILIAGGSAGTAAAGDRGDWIAAQHGGITHVGAWHGDRSPGRDWNRGHGNGHGNRHRKHWNKHHRGNGHGHRWRGRDRWSRNDRWNGGDRYYSRPYYNNWGARPYYNPYYGSSYVAPYYGNGYAPGWNYNYRRGPGCN